MPTVLITTLSEEGKTNIGAYSLVFPFGIAGEHAMMLISRADSNTAKNIRRTKVAALNFIPYDKKMLTNTVSLGFPGKTAEEKLKESIFTLVDSHRKQEEEGEGEGEYPEIIEEAIQVFECTWNDNPDTFHYKGTEDESHFLLKIDKILLKNKWYDALLKGEGFPSLPIDYGFRDNIQFQFAEHKKPYAEPLPKTAATSVQTVFYQANRIDPEVEFTMEACEMLVNIPRIFLKRALQGIVDEAKKENIKQVTPEVCRNLRDKRRKEKN